MSEIKLVTIDFWNTLFDSSNGKARNALRLRTLVDEIDNLKEWIPAEQITKAMEASWDHFEKVWKLNERTPPTRETVEYIWTQLKLPMNDESITKVERAFSDGVIIHPPKLIENAFETISALSKEYKVALISDTGFSPGIVLRELMKQNKIYDCFDSFSFSDETGVSKPNPKAYFRILNELNIAPENAVHIGDIEHTDIAGAKNIGMLAIRFTGDLTDFVSERNTASTQADAETSSWLEVQQIIKRM